METKIDIAPPDSIQPIPADTNSLEGIVISDRDKEEFFKAFLSEQPYRETVPLLDGKINVTFRTITVEEQMDVTRQMSMDTTKHIAGNDDSYLMRILSYRLAVCIESINDELFQPTISKLTEEDDLERGQTYIYKRARVFNKWPVFKLGAFQEAFKKFENKVYKLTLAIEKPDFWKAAG